jgi:OOP family OmpA-OmpF porin
MRSTFNQKLAVVAVALALGVLSVSAYAQAVDINEQALLLDTRGAPVMSGTLCWHSAYGPAPLWTAGCHPDVPAPIAQYVAPAAMPATVAVAAAPAQPVYEKVALDANVLFDSDQSALRAAGRDTLDRFVSDIHGLDSQSIRAIGYADRMGSEASNQILSEERVNTVSAYLVSKGVALSRVQASARGETRPRTYAAQCGDANNAKNAACMQPDRHVSVEISGMRLVK